VYAFDADYDNDCIPLDIEGSSELYNYDAVEDRVERKSILCL
jgi:hypothetical protein